MTIERKFDRIPSVDTRNNDYPINLLWTRPFGCGKITEAPVLVSKTWDDYAFLDQGSDGACVGFGISGELASEPEAIPGIDYTFAMTVYNDAKRIDEWPGENYEGTSVLAGAKVAQNRGYYSNYLWTKVEADMATTVSNFGPVVIGVNWHWNMMNTDADGYLHLGGGIAGGHCVVVIGINVEEGYYLIRNSWGAQWGENGAAKITREDMAKLIADDGEVMKPLRVHLSPEPEPVPIKCGFWIKLWNLISQGKWGC